MTSDRELIRCVMNSIAHLNGVAKTNAIEEAEIRINQYTIACDLSRGGTVERSQHWEREAQRFAADLKAFIVRYGGSLPECSGV